MKLGGEKEAAPTRERPDGYGIRNNSWSFQPAQWQNQPKDSTEGDSVAR